MKKQLLVIALVITAVFIFGSCSSPFHPMPKLPPSDGDTTANTAPENVTASHGGKRSITLSWTQKSNTEIYYIYRADSPLKAFVRCGETANTSFTFPVAPGSTIYYRVSAVSYDGKESMQSGYARGTSLAQPWITDITNINESNATVTWYMDNVAEDTYKSNLLYTVYCYNGSTEVAQIALDGSMMSENRAVFTSLGANTRYEYVVEAYLRSDQSASEKSEKMDAATARRFRPGPPEKLKATRGTSKEKIELTFELPDMVDIALGENMYDPKPLYFVISKRLYSETHSNEYLPVCSYFGSDSTTATAKLGKTFTGYVPGALVTWTDDAATITRGAEYEYQVQSYVDNTPRTITSEESRAHAVGWTLSEANLSFNDVAYTLAVDQDLFEFATLPLDFDFDPKGEDYHYTLIEKIERIEDGDPLDPDTTITKSLPFNTHEEIRSHVPAMKLLHKTNDDNSGRGVYSYTVEIRLDSASALLDRITTIGKVEVSENTQPVIVEKFSVVDGYTDKFVLKWHYWSNRKYEIFISDNREGPWTSIHVENASPTDDENATGIENHEWTYSGQTAGLTKYFAIQPARDLGSGQTKQGQRVYARTSSQTLGVPQISLSGGASYGFITATWTPAQKADTYRVKYWYAEEGSYDTATVAAEVETSELSIGADGNYRFPFSPFANNTINVTDAGKGIRIAVDALNDGLHKAVGGNEIATTSTEDVMTWLVGPAAIATWASQAAFASEIHVSWTKIGNADGYYVFRRQFNMTNTAEAGTEAVVYYVSADASVLTGKNMALNVDEKVDTANVKATVSFDGTSSRYTLKDMSISDTEYSGSFNQHTLVYKDQQNDMAQGYSYRYYVVPIVNRGGAPEPLTAINFEYNKDGTNKNTGIGWYTIRENGVDIRYNGAAALEKDGFTIGFGQNVTATKGTYASSGNVNDKIRITWAAPSRLATVAGFDPRYTLYRRATSSSVWEAVTSNITGMEYTDTPGRGIAYEYVVGISGSTPQSYQRFVDLCYTMRDDKNRPNMLGYMLEMVRMESVSKDWREYEGTYAEEVRWYSAGIKTSASTDSNWGIDGYEIYVLNQNIDGNWRTIRDVTSLINQTNQNAMVTNAMAGGGLLKVMRDYHHYFKVRSYVKNSDGAKIYCPDPSYSWSAPTSSRRDGGETDYVKWGARQIGGDEFIRIVSVHMAIGLDTVNGTAWDTGYFDRERSASGTNTQGSVWTTCNFGVTDWTVKFKNYRDDLQLRNGSWVTFLTMNGDIRPFTNAVKQYPQRYGYWDPITITGPSDTPGLYSGTFRTGDGGDLYWDSGYVRINYPTAGSGETRIAWLGQNTALPYSGRGDRRHENDPWK